MATYLCDVRSRRAQYDRNVIYYLIFDNLHRIDVDLRLLLLFIFGRNRRVSIINNVKFCRVFFFNYEFYVLFFDLFRANISGK